MTTTGDNGTSGGSTGKRIQDLQGKQLTAILDSINEVVYVADPETYEVLYLNRAARAFFGDVEGGLCYEVFQNLDSPCPFCTNERIFGKNTGEPYVWESRNEINRRWYRCIDQAIEWPDGRMVRYEMAIDITPQKHAEEAVRRQAEEILELATPVLQVWEGVLVAPLIGTLDSRRTQVFMERFLARIVETQSPVTLVDITGVPDVDTQTAQHLLEAVSAARLLGAEVILTGISPAIAQTLVHLGIDLQGIHTESTLREGLELALGTQGLRIGPGAFTPKNEETA